MKTILIAFIFISSHYQLIAQRPDFGPQCKTAMKNLSNMVGDWEGTATVMEKNGKITLHQTEHIIWSLDSMVLTIEGIGRDDNEVAFHAYALLNYDPFTRQYKFRSYVKEGYTTDAYFKIISDNKFEWGFEIPTGGKTKYTIEIDPMNKTWNERGEYSRDGNTWMNFIDLNLKRK